MGMVGQQCPRVTGSFGRWNKISEALQEVIAVFIASEYISAFNAANNDVV
jgi:hypothetical protein